jgi:hypothetical protein
MYDQLLSKRLLLPTLERNVIQLRDSHLAWRDQLSHARPDNDQSQIASAALEFALQELVDSLPPIRRRTTAKFFPSKRKRRLSGFIHRPRKAVTGRSAPARLPCCTWKSMENVDKEAETVD